MCSLGSKCRNFLNLCTRKVWNERNFEIGLRCVLCWPCCFVVFLQVVPIIENDGSSYVIKEGGTLVQYFTVTGSKYPGDFTVTSSSF